MFETGVLTGLCVGALIAGVIVWLASRKSAERAAKEARSEALIESARATERSALQAAQIESLKSNLISAETKTATLQRQIEECNVQRARLEEQTSHLSSLEHQAQEATAEKTGIQNELLHCREELATAQATSSARQDQVTNLGEEVLNLTRKRDDLLADQSQQHAQIAELNTALDHERKQNSEKIALLSQAREELTATFKNLANEILEDKSRRFTDLNKANLDQILGPLQTRIQEFKQQVEQAYVQESNNRAALGEQVRQLITLNQQLSDDANNLTKALKGSGKHLGNWGEMILEQILESCGLQKNTHYFMRPTYTRQDSSRAQPDAVVLLPGNRSLVVDSKASLNAYHEYVGADTEDSKGNRLDEHAAAVRKHVNDLSVKDYEDLPDLQCPDFVVMFVPIEPAFILAVTHDTKLWEDAWKKNVLLVSPSSLLFVIRIVANLWTQEAQRKHFQEIAGRGAVLYDKFVGFVEDLRAVGQGLEQAKEKYDAALSKLSEGKGNLVRQAEMLRGLGVRSSKELPPELLQQSLDLAPASDLLEAAPPNVSDAG